MNANVRTLWIFWLACLWATGFFAAPVQAQTHEFEFKRVAVAPFLVGKREPEMDAAMDQTLSCPINQICIDDPTIAPHAGSTLTRLTFEYLQQRFNNQIVPLEAVTSAYAQLTLDENRDTPRSLAMKLGPMVSADAVLVGTVWRYRDRGALANVADSPASVAFAVYLIETVSGRQLWRGIYSVTQQPVTENLFKVKDQLKLGLKWRTADEIAGIGVEETFKDFAANPQSP